MTRPIEAIARLFDLRRLPLALLVVGTLMRGIWTVATLPGSHASGEIANVAIAYANTGILADAFRPGQGPTAHVLPLPPVYAGLIYRTLGVRSPAAEMVLATSAIAIVMFSYSLFYRAFGIIGMPRRWRVAALAVLCLVPLNIQLEIETFRIWEGGLSVAVAALVLCALLILERRPNISWTEIAGMALLAAMLFFISPPFGLAGYLCALLLMVDRLPQRRWAGAAGIAVTTLTLLIVPWAWRNQQVMGEALPLRSNAGLELALGNHAAAAGPDDPRKVFKARLKEIHPFESDNAFSAMRAAGGEILYARNLGTTAKAWIVAHPREFGRICVRHLRDFFFPPAWLWNVYSAASRGTMVKVAINSLLSAATLAGALVAGVVAWRRYRFAILMLLVPAMPYIVVQPVLRYRYIVYALSVFFAADLAARLRRLLRRLITTASQLRDQPMT